MSADSANAQDTDAVGQMQSLTVGCCQMNTLMHEPRSTGGPSHRQGAGWSVYSGAINAFTKDFAMKRLISSLAALVAVACLVTACGQKGPLYLPDDTKTPEEQAKSQSHKHL
ncbi:Lipoprotein LppL [Pseudomonas coronafaciens pv. porri]|nr:Lipoprotein LppL [Pseudomonas coronafaciens pv. atropurpurea]KPX28432.1 Lipoprotein LppL [Pseudomonas coronafaciens pv. garcae]KPY19429.1 Lipoprotein LppL [Pseudomonas coronafaciens pv. porri]RMM75810.1 Lipoprotein LppL [Pseudomonas coronafaciens pv. striafaciens]RMN25574.1 Lipoprotein LppL [Pseudomonas coronafaciens pv. zizaniae]RMS98584.1 Lipoprotein LppL [Pseudomonas coronafaciens pv. oryzae]